MPFATSTSCVTNFQHQSQPPNQLIQKDEFSLHTSSLYCLSFLLIDVLREDFEHVKSTITLTVNMTLAEREIFHLHVGDIAVIELAGPAYYFTQPP